ncbi:lipid-A-disaccharide synthase [Cesiribacter andamanensis]|uniref:Lipid-A-disaccharide synthase n=1 Tax=Cesiribacter andamanensis AMV16 TaxID=1279009 RepID=M7N7Y7_9BACT|nr:lipid-A-disaccharide synthase [Cesiribacter andamanensis]EMR03362.1 Lipid-A-disaccharide synthase [Cesiribacter andamanensis AMV16]
MKYFLIAGERSGDLHGGNLVRALRQEDADANCRGFGGEYMAQAGMQLLVHYEKGAFMGFLEVAANLPIILGLFRRAKQEILKFRPDVIILIDYAGFNLRMAKWAKEKGFKVYYYISPKIWAWNQKRALKIKKYVDRMFVIMPFEQEFYQRWGMTVDFVGNPLLDAIRDFTPKPEFRSQNSLSRKPIIALLPGSRKQEVASLLEVMLPVSRHFPDYTFVIAGLTTLPAILYAPAEGYPNVQIAYDQTYELLSEASAAVVASGTATLETALFEVPQVVVYKTGWTTYQIAKRLITVQYISLANLVAGEGLVPELIQHELTQERLQAELQKIVPGGPDRNRQLQGYQKLKSEMGEEAASQRTARLMVGYLQKGG